MQNTVKTAVAFSGVGLHSGEEARLAILPAPAGRGIWFRRVDAGGRDPMVPARWDAVAPSRLCTRIENADGVSVSTVEHLMAALAGCGVHNALVEIDGPEAPVLDGSAAPFVAGILDAGLRRQDAPVRALRVLEAVEVSEGGASARIEPAEDFEIDFRIDFPDAAIGAQSLSLSMANGAFVRELCDSRTFCRRGDVEAMRGEGLARGGSMENAVVVEGDRVLTPGGLRRADEAVRHKMLDAMGDLALAGFPILGRFTGIRSGHALTNRLVRRLFADPRAFRPVPCDGALAARLPGVRIGRDDLAGLKQAA